LNLFAFEAGFGAADVGKEHRWAKRVGVVEHAGEEGRQGVVGDVEACRHDVEVHDDFGDEERCGSAVEAPGAGEEEAEDAGEAGADDVVGGESLVLVGGGQEGGAGRPERVEDDHEKENAEETTAGWNVASGPMGEEPGANGQHDDHDH